MVSTLPERPGQKQIVWPEEERLYLQGNEALAEAAIRAGCRFYAGYPIAPSSEILEYMSKRLPEVGGVCMFPGTEIEGITMVQGAAATGARAMIASSSTAMSLMQETMAECANAGYPIVAADVCRGTLQGDYYQAVKGGGHGEYQWIVFGPETVQEMADLTQDAFDLAQRYRHPAFIFSDVVLARTSSTVVFKRRPELTVRERWSVDWTTDATPGRERRRIHFGTPNASQTDFGSEIPKAPDRMRYIAEREIRYEERWADDAEYLIVAFGTAARYGSFAIEEMRKQGIKIGLFRPITLSPFPYEALAKASVGRKGMACFELNTGQMIYDVRSAIFGRAPVASLTVGDLGDWPGSPPSVARVLKAFHRVVEGETNGVAV